MVFTYVPGNMAVSNIGADSSFKGTVRPTESTLPHSTLCTMKTLSVNRRCQDEVFSVVSS